MNGKMFFGRNNSRNSSSLNGFSFNFEFPTVNLANLGTNLNPNRISSSLSNLLNQNSKGSNSEIMVCEGCGTKFHFLKRKRTCIECCMDYCASCLPRVIDTDCLSSRRNKCRRCRVFSMNPMDRNALLSLRVRDLRWYLNKRHVLSNYCKEKSELVDLILQSNETQSSNNLININPFNYSFYRQSSSNDAAAAITNTSTTTTTTTTNTTTNTTTLTPNQSSDVTFQASLETDRINFCENLEPSISEINVTSEGAECDPSLLLGTQNILSENKKETSEVTSNSNSDFKLFNINDLKTEEDIHNLSVRQIKLLLTRNFVDYKGCCEKEELFKKALRLWREVNQTKAKDLDELDDSNACKICMERTADCVLLECGHVVTCIDCGKKMNECPICRQYVVRVLRIYKS